MISLRYLAWCLWWVGLGVLSRWYYLPSATHFLLLFVRRRCPSIVWENISKNSSSVGLGTGLHTFILYLGPHIGDTSITISCIPIVTPEVLFLIFSFFFSCSNNGCIWMWYTWLPWASLPQYYSVPPGRPDGSFGPSMSWWISDNTVTLTFYPWQPTGGDGSAASLLEVGVWAIIAKVLTVDGNPSAQCQCDVFRWGWRRSVGGWVLPSENCLRISWQGLQGSQVCTLNLNQFFTDFISIF